MIETKKQLPHGMCLAEAIFDQVSTLFDALLDGKIWNWMTGILAFSMRVGPLAAWLTFLSKTRPFTSSVSSTMPPRFFTILTSQRSTMSSLAASMMKRTALAVRGVRSMEYWLTTLLLREVLADFTRESFEYTIDNDTTFQLRIKAWRYISKIIKTITHISRIQPYN